MDVRFRTVTICYYKHIFRILSNPVQMQVAVYGDAACCPHSMVQ